MSDQRGDRIRERAYRIWQDEGEPHGRHDEHWARAEQEAPEEGPREDESAADRADAPLPSGTATEAPVEQLRADELSEPAATAAPLDPVTEGTPARPKGRRATKKGAA